MTKETHHAAVAAIQFALSNPEGMEFLRLWNEGEFDILRRDWPEAPDSVYIGADPLAQQPEAQAEEVERRAWELLEAECGKPLPFDVPTHVALAAIRAALSQQSNDIASGGCTANGADVWCNGHIVATAHGLTLAPYRAARIATCLNACAGIEDPVAFIQKAKERCGGEEKRGPLAHSRNVIRQSLHWNGVPVHVTGTVTTSPGNWSLIDAALATQQREPNDVDRR